MIEFTIASALQAAVCLFWALLTPVPMQDLPLHYSIDKINELNPEAWGPVMHETGTVYRTVLKDRAAWFRIPGWWGNTVRPPRGAQHVMEVSYRDVVTEPVIAEVFGAVEVDLARSETHRFGGANDGSWKIANIPASWDMLIWPKGTKSAEFSFRATADLPIGSITIRKARLDNPDACLRGDARSMG